MLGGSREMSERCRAFRSVSSAVIVAGEVGSVVVLVVLREMDLLVGSRWRGYSVKRSTEAILCNLSF